MEHWVLVNDRSVRNVWECSECGDQINVFPYEYDDVGTPVCGDCGIDMFYVQTEYKNG